MLMPLYCIPEVALTNPVIEAFQEPFVNGTFFYWALVKGFN